MKDFFFFIKASLPIFWEKFFIIFFGVLFLQMGFPFVSHSQSIRLDKTFGDQGKVTTDFHGGIDEIRDLVIQPDGKIVVAGSAEMSGNNDFALARYNPDGSLDTSFGTGGKLTTDFFGGQDFAFAIAVQPDTDVGFKIVVVGYTHNTGTGWFDFALARYCPDGKLDDGEGCGLNIFGAAGKKLTDFGGGQEDIARDVVIQPDLKIVVAGSTREAGSSGDPDFALARYQTNGTLDSTFASGGLEITDILSNSEDSASTLLIQPDNKIIAGGTSNFDFALVRYCTNGQLDQGTNCGSLGFGSGGKVKTNLGGLLEENNASLLLPDGKILMGGYSNSSGSHDFALIRYQSDGSVDPTFGIDGRTIIDFAEGRDIGRALVLSEEGKIFLAGVSSDDFALVRVDIDGSLDNSFNGNGKVTTDFGGSTDTANAIVILSDGKIILAGSTTQEGNKNFALVRYEFFQDDEADNPDDQVDQDSKPSSCTLYKSKK